MSTGEQDLDSTVSTAEETEGAEPLKSAEATKTKLDLDVQISDVGPCKKHVKIAVSRADIDRQFEESLGSMTRDAAVPGFRPGHAPRQLVERRFRKQVSGQVKSALLMTALEQIDEDYDLEPINQPKLDIEAIELPDSGPMRFEIEVEVRPDFAVPEYKTLSVKRPVKSITEADVDAQLTAFLERHAQLVPKLEGGAEVGDYVTADLTFHRDGQTLNEAKEIQFRLQPEMRFQDGSIPKLSDALVGATPGDSREADALIGTSSVDPALRGQTIKVTFHVHDLKKLRLPQVDTAFLHSLGFENEDELRNALRDMLERRHQTQQRQAIRQEIMTRLLQETPFDLPEELVKSQEASTIRRLVMEMRQGGLSDEQIRAREAEIRANAHASTLRSLKEFFLLAKIADAENIKVENEDFELEIEAIAARTDESTRRVRSRVEKEGLADALFAQILERKALDRILDHVKYEEVPLVEESAVETLDQNATTAAPDAAESPAAEGEPEG